MEEQRGKFEEKELQKNLKIMKNLAKTHFDEDNQSDIYYPLSTIRTPGVMASQFYPGRNHPPPNIATSPW